MIGAVLNQQSISILFFLEFNMVLLKRYYKLLKKHEVLKNRMKRILYSRKLTIEDSLRRSVEVGTKDEKQLVEDLMVINQDLSEVE